MSLSADGRTALTASKDDVRLWHAANGVCISRSEKHDKPFRFAAFTANGHQILTASGSVCMLLEAATGECLRVFAGHAATVNWCEFSLDGAVAVTASDDGSVRLWDVSDGECLRTFTCQRQRGAIMASIRM